MVEAASAQCSRKLTITTQTGWEFPRRSRNAPLKVFVPKVLADRARIMSGLARCFFRGQPQVQLQRKRKLRRLRPAELLREVQSKKINSLGSPPSARKVTRSNARLIVAASRQSAAFLRKINCPAFCRKPLRLMTITKS